MARNEQLIRQHKVMQLLEASRYGRTLEELRDELVKDLGLTNLHERTVRRDIDALQASGLDIQSETLERGKVYKLGRVERGLHKISLSTTELIALSIGRDLLYPLIGTQYWQGIESFWTKVQEEVPEGVWEHYEKYRKTLHVVGAISKSYAKHEMMLRAINRGIADHRVLDVEYAPVGSAAKQRFIEPYGLAFFQNNIYLVAAAQEITDPQERMRHWKLDRFTRVTVLDQWFKRDPSIDLNEHLNRTMGIFSGDDPVSVQIRLSERAAVWVTEEPWHPDQSISVDKNGNSILTVLASHPRELMPKLLALGSDAEVISPEPFRTAVTTVVEKMLENYRDAHSNAQPNAQRDASPTDQATKPSPTRGRKRVE
jgi:predicted DNA-binding transcriptional regulator YafY